MQNEHPDQVETSRRLSFSEIILTYARNPPLQVMDYLKMGRRSRRGNGMSHYVLLVIERSAVDAGVSLKDAHESMRKTLGVAPENLSRPLTIDEVFTMCDMHDLEISQVLLESKRQFDARDTEKEDEL